MIDNFESIKKAYDARDLKALDAFAVAKSRTLNKKNDFRSALMLSCNNLNHLLKIESLEADCIILNLEDGVSKQDKHFALVLCAIFLSYYRECSKKLVVRVNALNQGGYEEITYLNQFSPDAVRVPKIRTKKEVELVNALLNDDIELHLSIETNEAWQNLSQLKIDKRVTTFYLGILDLFAEMGLSQSLISRDNPTVLYMLSHFLVTCETMGVKPVSFVYQDYKNLAEFSRWIELEKRMGYTTKGCISPAQAELVNQAFVDEAKQIQRAHAIVKLFELHRDEGITGFSDEEFGFVDEPIYKGALALIEKSRL
ncbi:aldolase/citrate lyase family protein [Sulfurimonas sp.]|uniref:HpcH/HpaI aldolase/citrate lyase family protein n=1 Tax=Sulfurimonas sp. TaxID=2022749 RepID=UPI0025CC0BAD|nr:aldolase/citrate lyase family protein [Sulfurimonas sp.]MDD5157073.1 aldolase/citrate lyase family protein [Sulfurimonas sp.]